MLDENEPKKRRDRSPSYPAIPLSVAVDKVRDLYRQEKAYFTPIDTVLQHWKYSPKSGTGAVAVAAALKFGLLEDEGSGAKRRAKVSDLGLRIVRDEREESPDRDRLLREAALMPALHRELWEKYDGSLPSDANLRHTLKFEYGFTDIGAQEFAREFRTTIAFARLADVEDAPLPDPADHPARGEPTPTAARRPYAREASDSGRGSDSVRATVTRSPTRTGMILPLPIVGSDPESWPSLHLPDRLSESDWNLMIVVLTAMKPGIVKAPVESGIGHEQAAPTTIKLEAGPQEAE